MPRIPSVGIHLKVIASRLDIDVLFRNAYEVFSQAGISVEVMGVEDLSHLTGVFAVPRVGSCEPPPSRDQLALFDYRNGAASAEVVFYFVRQTRPDFFGCAVHPADQPGAIIANTASQWTLAHELGHVLGLSHTAVGGR